MTPRETIRVLLDTNFLMLPLRFGVDIKSELGRIVESSFKLVTTLAVVDELLRLKHQVKPGKVKEIDFALATAEGIEKIDDALGPKEDVDDQLIRLAESRGVVVATTDAELRRRLRKAFLPVIYMRQSRYLAIDGII
ncbi:TPA: twitching motility protein PilT [Candidatus Bathyarchaeota archaeon]|nr:twitching motility protein PilT [Candidatus Bathyarchaeota archaeon]